MNIAGEKQPRVVALFTCNFQVQQTVDRFGNAHGVDFNGFARMLGTAPFNKDLLPADARQAYPAMLTRIAR